MALLHRVSKNTRPFYYYDNFGKREPIFTFFSLLNSEKICRKKEIKTSTYPQICCRTTLWNVNGQLYSFTFIRITCFMSSDTCFTSSYLFIYLFLFLILTSLSRYFRILFVALLIPFSYEDKRLAQHSKAHNWRIRWPVAFTCQTTHNNVQKADILNTWRKLARVKKNKSIASLVNIYNNYMF